MFKKFRKRGIGKIYSKGTTIFTQGDPGTDLLHIASGKIALILNHGQSRVRLGVFEKGDIFGIPHLFGQTTRYCSAVALEESKIMTLSKKLILERMHSDPSLMYNICKMLNDRLMGIVDECPCVCDEFGYCETNEQF
ncbi:MAG: cyclic nucleotide-binding domain-containing protein [Magnetococcales bacterium]|nr:cyclic nucleotide-binding domain-containing protein [Magnetococcales bacterium]